MILLKLLVLILRNHLQDPAAQTPPQGFKYAYYEVIIPRKLTPRYGPQEIHYVNYWLQIEGKGNLVHLRQKKGIIPKQFPVFTYSKEGNRQVDYPFIRDDCYYQGFVQDMPSSLAALNTCSGGLRGILRLDNKTYEILPIQPSATFQHVVYRLEQKEDAVTMKCGLTEEERRRQEAMMHSRQGTAGRKHLKEYIYPHIRYVKIVVVVDFHQYNHFGKNDTLVALQVIEIVHLSNTFYEPLAVQISLNGLEIWSQNNAIKTNDTIGAVLHQFSVWRRDTLNKRIRNDVGSLWVYQRFPHKKSTIGLAFVGGVCDPFWGSNVIQVRTGTAHYVSITFSHEIGHNLGMSHDENHGGDVCICSHPNCIMAAHQTSYGEFSNCSYDDFFSKRRQRSCLFIPPDPENIFKQNYCGNKIVEHGEQCDCGSERECDSNPCCQNNCMLRPGATCALGTCCKKCSYLPAGTICRKGKSICDLPEYCKGTSEFCPNDLYVQNGTPCKDGTYCYNGSCSTHYDQCQEIFGSKAIVASDDCFRTINIQGDRFGNCGLDGENYKKCPAKDVLCGRIQCEKVDHLLVEEHRTVIQTPIGDNKKCWGTDYHSGMNLTDIGAVKDGTPCGTNMMCINGICTTLSLLKYDCNATKCHNHGRCNNLKQCHCDAGWAPPDCRKEGYGGSIDSGPPPSSSGSNDESNKGSGGGSGGYSYGSSGSGISIRGGNSLGVILGICLFFLLVLVLLTVLVVYHNSKEWLRKKFQNQTSTKSEKTSIKEKNKIEEMGGKE